MFLQAVEEQPSSFEAVYSHALALQELATRAASEPAEGLRLLTQVILGCKGIGYTVNLGLALAVVQLSWPPVNTTISFHFHCGLPLCPLTLPSHPFMPH